VTRCPAHDARVVARLALQHDVRVTMRATAWLANHDYDVSETVTTILTSLPARGRWIGSAKLLNGAIADEYIVHHDAADGYLKFWVDDEKHAVEVWSCCWDGAVH
jgi:hypothetical protein